MKKKKNKDSTIYLKIVFIVIGILAVVIVALLINKNTTSKDEVGARLEDYGYTIGEKDEAFYNKITTNNTLDDYYNDMSNNKNSSYQEFYVSKSSYDFIELKMSYEDKIIKTLNITSDLKTTAIEYNFELSYNDIYLILEGTSNTSFTCNTITERNTTPDVIKTYCNTIKQELISFTSERNKILADEKIQNLLKNK